MMNNSYNTTHTSILQKQGRLVKNHISSQQPQYIKNPSNIALPESATLMHNSPHTNNIAYVPQQHQQICQNVNAQSQLHQQQQQQQQQPLSALHPHSLVTSVSNPRQSLGSASTALFDAGLGRFYSTAPTSISQVNNVSDLVDNGFSNVSRIPNTILINNFTPQLQTDQSQQLYQQHTVQSQQQNFQHRLPGTLQLPHSSIAQQAPQPNHILQQQQQQYLPQHNIASTSNSQAMQLHLQPSQPFYVSSDAFGAAPTTEMSPYLPSIVNNTLKTDISNVTCQQQHQTHPSNATNVAAPMSAGSSPVVLDRINICINNHYTDSSPIASTISSGTGSLMLPTDTPPLTSPIIPPIQHNPVIDPALLIEPLTGHTDSSSNCSSVTATMPVISEPDSTTTSHTPPTTPENTNPITSIATIQSPSTSSTATDVELADKQTTMIPTNRESKTEIQTTCPIETTPSKAMAARNELPQSSRETKATDDSVIEIIDVDDVSPEPRISEISFAIGEDVFVRREDDRLYLGTVIDSKYQKFRVRFDDASEVWCSSKEMRRFGIAACSDNRNITGEPHQDESDLGPFCVTCKQRNQTTVEICERCGRGYHRKCTTETFPGSGEWLCKRCCKPMTIDETESVSNKESQDSTLGRRQLPYDIESLTWDSKHRVNQEQIYCYCGKSGQFDHKMLQCCKCLNWYHTNCVKEFEYSMLRGDGFFVFCCLICSTDGKEFLRRLKLSCVDFVHLILYNLSTQKKHQQHKYHHLSKDIWPFVLAQRHTNFPEEWQFLTEDELKERIAATLKSNSDRFVCGREVKRDCFYYGLRNNGPPILPKINIHRDDVLSDIFLVENLKLRLLNDTPKINSLLNKKPSTIPTSNQKDIYDFNIDGEDEEDEDEEEKFTSDDEIPIKHIIEMEKKNKKSISVDTEDNIEMDCKSVDVENLEKENDNKLAASGKRNHKRKAFTLSRPYKETAAAAAAKRYHSIRNCDSSSDENSSSSRGTSLDLIIPPPKDFLGCNNPFRTVTPKKNGDKKLILCGSNNPGGPAIKNSVVNTTALDFSSKLAALKSAGIFPNLSTTNLAKAAGQPRMVRTIKRRLSAKDIMIGPNQEVRRRRTRRLSANIEVISTTTINPIPSNLFSINAKELFTSGNTSNTTIHKHNFQNTTNSSSSSAQQLLLTTSSSSSLGAQLSSSAKLDVQPISSSKLPSHGRRLRIRTQKPLPANSRRNSLSGASTSSNSSSCTVMTSSAAYPESTTLNDLQQSVTKYFRAENRLTTGEHFSVHAKRQLSNGQVQYLIEWGNEAESVGNVDSTISSEPETLKENPESSEAA